MSNQGPAKSSQAFRTIAEASDELGVPTHVLRFWEGKFVQIKPLKRAGGRRHYRPDDMALLRGIRALLQEDGYQLKGVQKLLKDQGIAWVRDRGQTPFGAVSPVEAVINDRVQSTPMVASVEYNAPEPTGAVGPLFEAAATVAMPENISPAVSVMLRRALVKLENARKILDHVAKNHG